MMLRLHARPAPGNHRLLGSLLHQLVALSFEDVVGDYPYLERDDVLAALEYASIVVNEREVPVARPA